MRKGDTYIVMYATVTCLIGSLLLAATSAGLKKQQDKMIELDRKTNVLKAFQVPVLDEKKRAVPGDQIEKLYADHVRAIVVDAENGSPLPGKPAGDKAAAALIAGGKALELYQWEENGQVLKYAFPVSGKGLWSTIYGYLALDAGAKEIVGVSFYKHGETPGLGGEIEKSWFQDQFRGRTIFANGHVLRVEVAKGKAPAKPPADKVVVDGISGSTLTGNGVTRFLNSDLKRYDVYFKGLRKG